MRIFRLVITKFPSERPHIGHYGYMQNRILLFMLFLSFGPFESEVLAQILPFSVHITSEGVSPGVTMFSAVQSANQVYLTALNEEAESVFSAHSPVKGFIFEPWGDDEFVFYNYAIRKFVVVDSDLVPTDTLGVDLDSDTDYHDVHRYVDGSYLIVNNEYETMDLTSYGGVEDAAVIEPVMRHILSDGTIIREWRGLDHFPISVGPNLTFQTVDYLHWNAFDFDSLGGLLMSFRNTSTIARLRPDDWTVDWELGGSGNDFVFDDEGWGTFLNQHDINDLGNERLLLFDNSTSGGFQPGYSRVVEYDVDTVAMTASRVWSYSHIEEIYAPAQGSVERLENGNTLIAWGNANAPQGLGTVITEINSEGEIVWEVEMGPYFTVYRARKFPESEVLGCRDELALNYDGGVLVDDGSCYYGVDNDGDGMLDSEGDCDDSDASVYLGATEIPNDGIDQDCDGEDLIFIPGCTNSMASNFNSSATTDDGSCLFNVELSVDMFINGGGAALVTELGIIEGTPINFGVWRFLLQIPTGEFSYHFVDSEWVEENIDRNIFVEGPLSLEIVCFNSYAPCLGCDDPEFVDFNPFSISDGSLCLSTVNLGCTYLDALNFDPTSNIDDGTCVFDQCTSSTCPGDLNSDGSISTDDLLLLLIEWGTICQ
ncbi:MAG TPA: hypothetical protein EYN67_15120 [Flavobacteriales bacterium]|nr:hypothetical protein [Flavobacteriales bacterium]HIB76546.1 hypothetical protein [Flavobacteriales bacterium]